MEPWEYKNWPKILDERCLTIDFGASFTKVAIRPGYRSVAEPLPLNKAKSSPEEKVCVPSLVARETSKSGKWFCSTDAAKLAANRADTTFFRDWKKALFSPRVDSDDVTREVATRFFQWLRRHLQGSFPEEVNSPIRLCHPAFPGLDAKLEVLRQVLTDVGWRFSERAFVTEAEASGTAFFTTGKNWAWVPPGTQEINPHLMHMFDGFLLDALRQVALGRSDRTEYKALVADLGAYTLDLALIAYGTRDAEDIEDPSIHCKSVELGIHELDNRAIGRVGRDYPEVHALSAEAIELLKRDLYAGKEHALPGFDTVILGDHDHALKNDLVGLLGEFADRIVTEVSDSFPKEEIDIVVPTGGGLQIAAIRRSLLGSLGAPGATLPPKKRSLYRTACAVGGCSVLFELPASALKGYASEHRHELMKSGALEEALEQLRGLDQKDEAVLQDIESLCRLRKAVGGEQSLIKQQEQLETRIEAAAERFRSRFAAKSKEFEYKRAQAKRNIRKATAEIRKLESQLSQQEKYCAKLDSGNVPPEKQTLEDALTRVREEYGKRFLDLGAQRRKCQDALKQNGRDHDKVSRQLQAIIRDLEVLEEGQVPASCQVRFEQLRSPLEQETRQETRQIEASIERTVRSRTRAKNLLAKTEAQLKTWRRRQQNRDKGRLLSILMSKFVSFEKHIRRLEASQQEFAREANSKTTELTNERGKLSALKDRRSEALARCKHNALRQFAGEKQREKQMLKENMTTLEARSRDHTERLEQLLQIASDASTERDAALAQRRQEVLLRILESARSDLAVTKAKIRENQRTSRKHGEEIENIAKKEQLLKEQTAEVTRAETKSMTRELDTLREDIRARETEAENIGLQISHIGNRALEKALREHQGKLLYGGRPNPSVDYS